MIYNKQEKKQLKDALNVEFGQFLGLDEDSDIEMQLGVDVEDNERELIALHEEMSKKKKKK